MAPSMRLPTSTKSSPELVEDEVEVEQRMFPYFLSIAPSMRLPTSTKPSIPLFDFDSRLRLNLPTSTSTKPSIPLFDFDSRLRLNLPTSPTPG